MPHVVDTGALVAEGVLSPDQARIIAARSRGLMVSLGINVLLTGGIVAATGGFILWLGTPLAVALTGIPFLLAGVLVLLRAAREWLMFGHAAALIGGGMLLGGATVELLGRGGAGPVWVTLIGAAVALGAGLARPTLPARLGFPSGAALAAGTGMHLVGLYAWALLTELDGAGPALNLYAAALLVLVGWRLDVRAITALAVVPFAQVLDTGTVYWTGAYVFYSPEPTLTILQMGAFAGLCAWAASRLVERHGRHALILALMAAVVGNLSFLVGSIWGDVPGAHLFGPRQADFADWEAYWAAEAAFREGLVAIHEHVFAVVWALLLIGAAAWAAHAGRRGLFNTAMTFGAIHAYTQMFETFGDEPLAYVLGGLAAVPLAWGLWRLNRRFEARAPA